MEKILILKRDKLGDLLLTTPLIRVLRQAKPNAEIHLLASDYNAWVVKDLKVIDRIWVYKRTRIGKQRRIGAIFQQVWQMLSLRKQNFDAVIVAQGGESDRAIKRALKIKAKRTIAYCESTDLSVQLSDPISTTGLENKHESDKMVQLLKALDIRIPAPQPLPIFHCPEPANAFAKHFVSEHKLQDGFVIIGLGARRAKKQPSTEQILALSHWLYKTHQVKTLFMWTPGKSDNPLYPGDDETAEPVLQANRPEIIPFRGPLLEAIGLIFQARLSIFPDSGLMHFAATSPGGVLGLFAETDVSPSPIHWGPVGKNTDIIEADKSISEISIETFQHKIEALLGNPSA